MRCEKSILRWVSCNQTRYITPLKLLQIAAGLELEF